GREEFVRTEADVFRPRVGADGFSFQEAVVRTTVAQVRNDGCESACTRLADCRGEEADFDNSRVRMRALNQHHMFAFDRSQEPHILFSIWKASGMLLELYPDSPGRQLAGDRFREGA